MSCSLAKSRDEVNVTYVSNRGRGHITQRTHAKNPDETQKMKQKDKSGKPNNLKLNSQSWTATNHAHKARYVMKISPFIKPLCIETIGYCYVLSFLLSMHDTIR